MSRTRRSAWTVGSSLVFSIVTMLVGFFATPYLVAWLGVERYGAFRVMVDWFSYLSLLNLGMIGAIIACMAPAVGRGERENIAMWLSAGMRSYVPVLCVMVSVGVSLTWVFPNLVRVATVDPAELRISGLLMLIPIFLIPFVVFRALAELSQLGYMTNGLLIAQSLLNTAFTLYAAWMDWGLLGQAIATVAAQLPMTVILTIWGIRLYPGFWRIVPAKADTKHLWTLNWQTFMFSLSNQVSLLSDNLVIGWALGSANVTSFFLTQRLASIVRGQLQSIGTSTWAGMLELHSRGEIETFRSRLFELTRIVSSMGVLTLGCIAAYNEFFITVWVGRENYAGDGVNVIASLNFWMWSIFSLWHWTIAGTGNIGKWVPYAIASTIINVSISLAATWWLGMIGPLLGTLAGFAFVGCWAVPHLLKQLFAFRPSDLLTAALQPLWWSLPYIALVWFVAHATRPQGYLPVLTHMGISGCIGLAMWWAFALDSEARAQWKRRFALVLGRQS